MISSLLLCALITGVAKGGDFSGSAVGTTASSFLKLGVGGRAEAMGEAFSAVVDDASAMYWNPAALTRVPHRSVVLMHAAGIDKSYFDYGAFAQNLGRWGSVGVGLQYFSAGKLTETDDVSGADVGTFSPYDLAASIGYAYTWSSSSAPAFLAGTSFGLTFKHIESKILGSAQTQAVDIGLLSPTFFKEKVRLAFSAVNMGGEMKFDQESATLPMAFRFGASCRLYDRLLTAMDVALPKDNAPYVALGNEVSLFSAPTWRLDARFGLNTRTIGDVEGLHGISMGLGWGVSRMNFDYAFLPFGSLGNVHRLSLSSRF